MINTQQIENDLKLRKNITQDCFEITVIYSDTRQFRLTIMSNRRFKMLQTDFPNQLNKRRHFLSCIILFNNQSIWTKRTLYLNGDILAPLVAELATQ